MPVNDLASDEGFIIYGNSLVERRMRLSSIVGPPLVASAIIVSIFGGCGPISNINVVGAGIATVASKVVKESSEQFTAKRSIFNSSKEQYFGFSILAPAYDGILEEWQGVEEASVMPTKRLSTNALVYGGLTSFGFGVGLISALSIYVTPILEQGIAQVLLRMAGVFLSMVIVDYVVRGKDHVRA